MAGGFQSTRKAGDFPSTGRTASAGGSGMGEVDTVNGVSPDAKGNVQLTASDVGAHSRGDADNKFELKRATGVIGSADDPATKPAGDYYVQEKFVNSPVVEGGSYVGVMRIILDFDGSNNGGLIVYYVGDEVFYKAKLAGGWSDKWQSMTQSVNPIVSIGLSGNTLKLHYADGTEKDLALPTTSDPAPAISKISSEEVALESQVADLEKKVDELSKHAAPPASTTFNPATVALTGGYADNWQDAVHVSTHKTGSPITITKVSDDAHNAVVMMSPEAAQHVTGITIDGGLPAKWESHAVTIGGTQYTAFISPYKLTKHPLNIGIAWS